MNTGQEEESLFKEINGNPNKIRSKIIRIIDEKNSVKGMHLNIRNQTKHIEQLRILNKEVNLDLDFIGLTECWKTEDELRNENIDIIGYDNVHSKSKFNKNGGVHIYINKNNEWKVIESDEVKEADYLEIEIQDYYSKKKYRILIIYRSPCRKFKEFKESLNKKLRKSCYKKTDTIIMGDINIDTKGESKEKEEILNVMYQNGFSQLINKPTRITANSSTLIDHCYTNILNQKIVSGVITTGITDHNAIYIAADKKGTKKDMKKRIREKNKIIKKTNYKKIKEIIENKDWRSIMQIKNPSEMTKEIQVEINKITVENTTNKKETNHYNTKRNDWVSGQLIKEIRKRDRWIYKRNKTNDKRRKEEWWTKIKEKQREIKERIKKDKKDYFTRKLKEKSLNTKEQWDIMNEMTGRSKTKEGKEVKELCINGRLITDKRECANELNNFFINTGSKNTKDENEALRKIKNNPRTMYLNPASRNEIKKIIEEMKVETAPGTDGIKMKIIKNSKETMAELITDLINKCIEEGEFPETLKTSIITPIFKKGDNKDPINYRPVSNLNSLAKIIERFIYNRIYEFAIDKCKIISKKQFAFMKGCSTTDAILEIVETTSRALDDQKKTAINLIDVAKAFDTVDHNILIKKIEKYGI